MRSILKSAVRYQCYVDAFTGLLTCCFGIPREFPVFTNCTAIAQGSRRQTALRGDRERVRAYRISSTHPSARSTWVHQKSHRLANTYEV